MVKPITILFLFVCHWGVAQNRSVYNQTWISSAYQFNYKKLNFKFDGSYRSIEYFKYNRQFLIREISTWNINKRLQIGAGPCLSWQYPYYNVTPVTEFRPTFQISGKTQVSSNAYENGKFETNKSEISIRLRWELRYFKTGNDWSEVYHRPRLALRSSIPITENLSCQPQLEAMWQRNPASSFKFSVGRIYIGFNYKLKKINYQIGYMFQLLERGTVDELDNNYIFSVNN